MAGFKLWNAAKTFYSKIDMGAEPTANKTYTLPSGGGELATTADVVTIANGHDLGVGQTWQDVTASRAAGTIYTNSTGKPIMVIIQDGHATNWGFTITLNGTISYVAPGYGNFGSTSFIVPDTWTYKINTVNSLGKWLELR